MIIDRRTGSPPILRYHLNADGFGQKNNQGRLRSVVGHLYGQELSLIYPEARRSGLFHAVVALSGCNCLPHFVLSRGEAGRQKRAYIWLRLAIAPACPFLMQSSWLLSSWSGFLSVLTANVAEGLHSKQAQQELASARMPMLIASLEGLADLWREREPGASVCVEEGSVASECERFAVTTADRSAEYPRQSDARQVSAGNPLLRYRESSGMIESEHYEIVVNCHIGHCASAQPRLRTARNRCPVNSSGWRFVLLPRGE
jgi:hypothetical protein